MKKTREDELAAIPIEYHDPVYAWNKLKTLAALLNRHIHHSHRAMDFIREDEPRRALREMEPLLRTGALIPDLTNAPRTVQVKETIRIPDPEPVAMTHKDVLP